MKKSDSFNLQFNPVAVNIKKARNRGVLLRMAEPVVLIIGSMNGFL